MGGGYEATGLTAASTQIQWLLSIDKDEYVLYHGGPLVYVAVNKLSWAGYIISYC